MRRVVTAALVLAVSLGASRSAGAQAITWTIDPGHSAALFTVRHLVIANVRGEFDGPTGTVVFDPKNMAGTLRVDATIATRTINTRNTDRDADLRSANFFDVAKFPTITFKSKRVDAASEGQFKLIGDLTMHGVTKEVTLDVEGPSPVVKDLNGQVRVGASATTVVDRRDFGLKYNELIEAGGAVVGDEVRIQIDLEMTHR